ncbi:recombination factor protein RarA [Idiomarina sp. X4]|nr:recombination factor protein RarA [Idiomarina sp. X4]
MSSLDLDFQPDFKPLAARMRPRTVDEYVGQQHLLAPGKPLRVAVEQGHLHSMILWGPPGTGKTTLAELIATTANATVSRISAVTSGVKDIRRAIEEAKQVAQQQGRRTILFVDEVHRFNKSQQDAFLPHIEDGTIVFVGATTENPGFELNNALLSRARVYRLQTLSKNDLEVALDRALTDSGRGLGQRQLKLEGEARAKLLDLAGGDARRLLNYLEVVADFVESSNQPITPELITAAIGEKATAFDHQGDHYYDILSAFHKSVRGSSPDGALYWYARLLTGGGDALVIARRLLAIASEDIGNADPRALQLALNAWDTYHRVGPAEGERAIAQATIYCACAAKSNAVYNAFKSALRTAKEHSDAPVPEHLRNAPTKVHKEQGYGADYQYAHNYPNAYVPGERYLPSELAEMQFYQPEPRGLEIKLQAKLRWLQDMDTKSDWKREPDE